MRIQWCAELSMKRMNILSFVSLCHHYRALRTSNMKQATQTAAHKLNGISEYNFQFTDAK
jgi:hypothetical protein